MVSPYLTSPSTGSFKNDVWSMATIKIRPSSWKSRFIWRFTAFLQSVVIFSFYGSVNSRFYNHAILTGQNRLIQRVLQVVEFVGRLQQWRQIDLIKPNKLRR